MDSVFSSYEQGAETYYFVDGFSKPSFGLVIVAGVFVDWRNKGTGVNVGVPDPTHKNSWGTSSIQISALKKRGRFEVKAKPDDKRAPCFAA